MTVRPGPTNSLVDVAGLSVGHAQDAGRITGVTVVVPDAPMIASVHVMGGAPGTRETDLLAPDKTIDGIHGLVLSGGSAYGLDAASGVVDALRRAGTGFAVGPVVVPIVPAAIIFDLWSGGPIDWAENPYPALGAKAFANLGQTVEIGTVGAGTGATTADLKGGLGSASLVLPSGATVAALAVCNALGRVTDGPDGAFWASAFEMDQEFGARGPVPGDIARSFGTKLDVRAGTNTTIAVVATDAGLTSAQAQRMAVAAHDGIARAVVPAHTPFDGDLVFAAATGTGPDGGPQMLDLCHAAAICLSRAIARGVYAASPAPGDALPTWQDRFADGTAGA